METRRLPKLAIETYILLGICLLDLASTVWLIATNQAVEGNPIMSFYVDHGLWALVVAKTSIAALALFIAEWGRRHRPQFVHGVLRFAILAYLGMYVLAFLNTNMLASQQHPEARSDVLLEQCVGGRGPDSFVPYQPMPD